MKKLESTWRLKLLKDVSSKSRRNSKNTEKRNFWLVLRRKNGKWRWLTLKKLMTSISIGTTKCLTTRKKLKGWRPIPSNVMKIKWSNFRSKSKSPSASAKNSQEKSSISAKFKRLLPNKKSTSKLTESKNRFKDWKRHNLRNGITRKWEKSKT